MDLSSIKENIVWYTYDKPRDIYKNVKHWFCSNWNIYHWRYVKQAFLSYPWDYGYELYMEEKMLDKQIYWFEHHQLMVDWQYEQIMRSLRWAKYCIHIMNNDTDLFHFTGDRWAENDSEDDLKYHYDGPKLNWRNANRFINKSQINYYKNSEHEYYLVKAKHLYYKLREYYTEFWWD